MERPGALSYKEGGLYLNIWAGVPRVPSYAAANEAGLAT